MIDLWLNQSDLSIIVTLTVGYGLSGVLCVVVSFLPAWRQAALRYNGVVAPFFVSAGTLFALMTAFLGSAVHDSVRNANQAVMQEREGALRIITLAEALPGNGPAGRLPDLTRTYIHSVLDHEWPLPAARFNAPQTEAALVGLLGAIADREIASTAGNAIQAAFLRAAEGISAGRVTRLGLSRPDADNLRWTGVLVLGLLTQLSVAAVHLDRLRPQVLALILSTSATIAALGVVATAERPFSGLLAVSREPLEQLVVPRPQ